MSRSIRHGRSPRRRRHDSCRLHIETLEDRRLLATFTVTTNLDVVDVDDEVTSLREAIAEANAAEGPDTIDFDFGHDGPETIVLTMGQLVITDDLTINGYDANLLTIDASGNDPTPDSTLDDGDDTNDGDGSRIFLFDDSDRDHRFTAEVRGLTLTGGDTGDRRGGAIHSRENLTVRESVIVGNIAHRGENETGGWGGGIQSLYGDLNVHNTTITGNQALTNGGGIDFNESGVGGVLNITGSTIEGNLAQSDGGGISISGDATIDETTIVDNRAARNGGGIVVWQLAETPTISVQNSEITGNEAGFRGGGFFSDAADTTVEFVGTTISGNEARNAGGGIAIDRVVGRPPSEKQLRLFETDVTANIGGGILFQGNTRDNVATIESSTISGNLPNGGLGGGTGFGIDAVIATLTVVDSRFENNAETAINVDGNLNDENLFTLAGTTVQGNGGGVMVLDMTTDVTGSTITGNQTSGIVINRADLTVTDSTISGNLGSGVRTYDGNVVVNGSTLNDNRAPQYQAGGGIYARSGNLTIESSTIAGNHARDGGGIYFDDRSFDFEMKLAVTGSTIRDNIATGRGGGIGTNGTVMLVDSTVSGNRAEFSGGGVFTDHIITLLQSTVNNNTTQAGSGGGIYGEKVMIVQSSVSGNSAVGRGGGIDGGEVTIDQSSVSGNSAAGRGGGVLGQLSVVVGNSNVSNNTAQGRGGGVRSYQGAVVTNSTIAGNRTTGDNAPGAGIDAAFVTILQSTISNNGTTGAQSHGGGVSTRGPLVVDQSTIVGNVAADETSSGGGIWHDSPILTLRGSIVAGNRAGEGGPDLDWNFLNPLAAIDYTLLGDASGLHELQLQRFEDGMGNQLDVDPHLGPLADHGGTVFLDGSRMRTHALLPGSPAIDAGDPAAIGAVALYRFEESAAAMTAVDMLGGFDGTYHGDPALEQPTVPAIVGNALGFDGVDDYVAIPRTVSDDFSISFWINVGEQAPVTGTMGIIGGDVLSEADDFEVLMINRSLLFRVRNLSISSGNVVTRGQWHHIAVTRDATSGEQQIFVDGERRAGTEVGPIGPMGAATELYVGQLLSGLGQFEGRLDELAFFDRVLSDEEIDIMASAGTPWFDQRGPGFRRVADGDLLPVIAIDIGAYESQGIPNYPVGDYNHDGIASMADYVMWRNTQGDEVEPFSGADANGNGVIGDEDYAIWRANFGNTDTLMQFDGEGADVLDGVPALTAEAVAAEVRVPPIVSGEAASAAERTPPSTLDAPLTPPTVDTALLVLLRDDHSPAQRNERIAVHSQDTELDDLFTAIGVDLHYSLQQPTGRQGLQLPGR